MSVQGVEVGGRLSGGSSPCTKRALGIQLRSEAGWGGHASIHRVLSVPEPLLPSSGPWCTDMHAGKTPLRVGGKALQGEFVREQAWLLGWFYDEELPECRE